MSRAALLSAALLAAVLGSCSDSSLSIRLVFPDAASIDLARRVELYALEPAEGETCDSVLGQPPDSFGDRLLARATLDLKGGASQRFPDVPMRSMLIGALVYDEQDAHFLSGCEPVVLSPGDDEEIAIYLDCAPGRTPCIDRDGDGVTSDQDCDDRDPCRSPKLTESGSLCGGDTTAFETEWFAACKARLALAGKPFTPPLCGDGIDQDCDGQDAVCVADGDCDGYAPPADCDDTDAKVNPGAAETCDGKDNNCNGVTDEGCAPCDVDGDGHAGDGPSAGSCTLPPGDTDDYDSGIHPDTTTADGGKEGGTLLGALRGYCSADKDKNGTSQREVDHDSDGVPASGDGCPSVTCDQDGDGFEGAQCSPPKSDEDCDDANPHVFPGAPDKCGDGVAQDCVVDRACSCDGDSDGYCPPADCDDKDAKIHPWATETCDRVDNDCDQLTDEGNPDAAGQPMPTNRRMCSDDNDGKCAPSCISGLNCHASGVELTGFCVCSSLDTSKISIQDVGNRITCPGEDLALPGSPRCFGAIQPTTEKCDKLDWSCDGQPIDPSGIFAEMGKTCSTDIGACSVGTVEKCDLSRTVDSRVLDVFAAQSVDFSPYWVCSASTKLPAAEICNGLDDDCDGFVSPRTIPGTDPGWAELKEQDGDSDGFLPCTGCTGTLAPGLKGCNDCNDDEAAVFPTAYEKCDGIDNNCKSGDEGDDECSSAETCCVSQKACRNLNIDENNCGSCGNTCPGATTDHCSSGKCVCGTNGGPCTDSLNCVGGSCDCIQGGLCTGCCDGYTCLPGNITSACGDGGESCQSCTASNPCQSPVCNAAGNCSTTPKSDGSGCPSGICHDGSCCTGCWDGSTCRAGTSTTYCGESGEACGTCSTTNPCKNASCGTGTCIITNKSNGTACPSGTCYAGSCCTGCWDGAGCEPGQSATACGVGGVLCEDCTAQSLLCVSGFCE